MLQLEIIDCDFSVVILGCVLGRFEGEKFVTSGYYILLQSELSWNFVASCFVFMFYRWLIFYRKFFSFILRINFWNIYYEFVRGCVNCPDLKGGKI